MLVCKLVRLHKGRIIISSTEGKVPVYVYIPHGKQAFAQGTFHNSGKDGRCSPATTGNVFCRTAHGNDENGKSSSRILVVEDNDDLRGYIERLLGQDYHVQSCTNGRDALVVARNITRT